MTDGAADATAFEHAWWHWIAIAAGIGIYAALVGTVHSLSAVVVFVAPLVLLLVAWWTLAEPSRWTGAFIASAILLPPLPVALGNSGPHPALFFAALGAIAGLVYLSEWRISANSLTAAFALLLTALVVSLAWAALYSGPAIAAQSFARVLLFGIGVYLFFFTAYLTRASRPPLPALFWAAVVSAAMASIDFYYQLPAPAGFGPQFVWLDTVVYRRAQGIFYEASTLGNFCAFFLVMIAVALTRRRAETPIPRPALVLGGVLFSAALIFSYSRASIVCLAAALCALAWIDRTRIRWSRAILMFGASIAGAAVAAYALLPDLASAFWGRLSGSARLVEYGEAIFSGRFESWRVVGRFLLEHPWHAAFGVGYKTLPYSDYIGQTVITDNMYLSMLAETGIVGLAVLVSFNVAVLIAAYRAARHPEPRASFLGAWIFCFWVGECFQMLSVDLLTFWRVLPVYFLVLAWAVRESSRTVHESGRTSSP